MRSSACKTWLGRLTTLLMAFALSSAFVFAQTKTVTGTVVDEMGEPVIGANVIVVGTTNGATTDIDGNFSIQDVANGASLISFSEIIRLRTTTHHILSEIVCLRTLTHHILLEIVRL